ncbi:winged helix-turn-helix transcriptional regulator [Halovivax gelatinilyticus]|uniref:winged helix-turn-helix transcriptional regulator n=1 Tax=Halovivax gelatinilyticus TaxID=2961597 RepID=UPI0020CA3AD4|nr:helix-turn-helix domain-containing protein [Halovivax gelatinilyticus]
MGASSRRRVCASVILVTALFVATIAVTGAIATAGGDSAEADIVERSTDDLTDTIENETDDLTDTVENETGDTLSEPDDESTDEADSDDDASLLDPIDDTGSTIENATDDADSVVEDTASTLVDEDRSLLDEDRFYQDAIVELLGEESVLLGTTRDLTGVITSARSKAGVITAPDLHFYDTDEQLEPDERPDRSADGSADDEHPMGGGPDTGSTIATGLLGLLSIGAFVGGGSGAGAGVGAGMAGSGGHVGRHLGRLAHLANRLGSVPWHTLPFGLFRYSRYDDSDPLEHETRRAIFETIEADPGRYLSAIEVDHDVSLSTIRHHVSVLESESLVRTEKQNGKRRYYPANVDDVELAAALCEPAKRRVVAALIELGDVPNGQVADRLDLDPSTVSHHLSALESAGIVDRTRDGRTIVNSLAPGVESAYRADGSDGANHTRVEPSVAPSDD